MIFFDAFYFQITGIKIQNISCLNILYAFWIEYIILFADLNKDIDITVCGWIRSLRDSKSLAFIDLNDGSCFKGVQIVFEETTLSNYKEIAKQNVGTALCVTGTFILTPDAKQPFELHAKQIYVEGASSPEYPLQKKRHSLEYLRTIAHLRPRTNTYSAVFRVRSAASFAIHQFFQTRGFLYAHTPIITGSDCEGAGEMFRVTTLELEQPPKTEQGAIDYTQDFFQKPTSLTVSGQLEILTQQDTQQNFG